LFDKSILIKAKELRITSQNFTQFDGLFDNIKLYNEILRNAHSTLEKNLILTKKNILENINMLNLAKKVLEAKEQNREHLNMYLNEFANRFGHTKNGSNVLPSLARGDLEVTKQAIKYLVNYEMLLNRDAKKIGEILTKVREGETFWGGEKELYEAAFVVAKQLKNMNSDKVYSIHTHKNALVELPDIFNGSI
jgi:hypothetical protein